MNRKQALIVDDSKTAQYLLKRMLQQYDLSIDIAASAEEALAYLSYNHPAVIFLDQQMTGMTGFEALKTIKANPHTALIPVIMYSSQNDDLFVSQAIALGAQGVLSKGAMHPANLQQVLERLSIRMNPASGAPVLPEAEAAEPAESISEVAPVARGNAQADAADLDKVRAQVGRLFELHVADIKTHLNNSTQFILKRLSGNIDRAPQRDAGISASALSSLKATIASALAAERQRGTRINRLLMAATIGITLTFGYVLLQMQADTENAAQKILAALEAKNLDRSMMTVAAIAAMPQNKISDAPATIPPALLQAISWAQHADFHFDYGEPPLSGSRLSNLHQLVQLLADGGYRGTVVVNLNFGNFCLEQDETNTLRLARSDVKANNCKMQKDVNAQFLVSDYLTLQYQSFEKNLAPLQDGRINIRLVSNGMNTPGIPYPQMTPQMNAGEWNRIALRNNRISIHFPG